MAYLESGSGDLINSPYFNWPELHVDKIAVGESKFYSYDIFPDLKRVKNVIREWGKYNNAKFLLKSEGRIGLRVWRLK